MLKTLAGSLALAAAHSRLPDFAARTVAPVIRRYDTRRADHSPTPLHVAVRKVFSHLSPEAVRTASLRLETNNLRNALVRHALLLGRAPEVLPRIRWADDGDLVGMCREGRAAIGVFCHTGHAVPTGLCLGHIGIRPLVFTGRPPEGVTNPPGEWIVVARRSTQLEQRALALKRALSWLKSGKMVVIAVDGANNADQPFRVPFLGRMWPFGRGVALLRRLTGAPIVPLVKSWTADNVMEIRSFPPLEFARRTNPDADDADRELTAEVVAWFDARLRAAPWELRVRTVYMLSNSPLAHGGSPGGLSG